MRPDVEGTSVAVGSASAATAAVPAVVVDDLHVSYRVYEDVRPTLRRLVARRFRPRPHVEVRALRGVSFTAAAGEAVGIIGRNGSGKSTLMSALAGLLPAERGTVHAASQPVLLAVGAALQGDLSGRRNIMIGGSALGVPRAQLAAQMDDIITFTGLADAIDRPLRTYSSGMAARLQFGIASAVRPDILLIDEALATGDAEFQRRSEARIAEIVAGAGTVFVVSHAADVMARMTRRSIWIDGGRVVFDGPTEQALEEYARATAAG
jgi:teichoic acid transport system ATP-binding protein